MLRKISALVLVSVSLTYSQPKGEIDSARVVILSTRLGPVISREARDHFMLFGYVADFRRAVVIQRKDSTFAVHFYTGKEGAVEEDTAIAYPFSTLKMISEKVDNFEALKAGTYTMGASIPTLRLADGATVSYVPPPAPLTVQQTDFPVRQLSGALPLAADPGYPRLRHFPSFDMGFGISSYSPDLSGLSQVYGHTPSTQSPTLTLGFEISISEVFGLQAEGGLAPSDHLIAEGWLGAAYYLIPFSDRDIRPYISAGLAFCSVEIRSGPYTDAGGMGLGVSIGLEFLLDIVAAIDIYGGYNFLPDVSGVFVDLYYAGTPIPASVSLGGAVFGVRIKFLQ